MAIKKIWWAWLVFFVCLCSIIFYFANRSHPVYNTPPKSNILLAFGDEFALGRGATSAENGFVYKLAQRLNFELVTIAEENGTSLGMVSRVFQITQSHPDVGIALVVLGANDDEFNLPDESSMGSMEHVFASFNSIGAMVVFASLDPADGGWRFRLIKLRAQEMGTLVVDDLLKGIRGNQELMANDKYPNDEGHALIAERLYSAIHAYLRRE